MIFTEKKGHNDWQTHVRYAWYIPEWSNKQNDNVSNIKQFYGWYQITIFQIIQAQMF